MIAFKDITIQDKDTITAYTMNSCRRNCDLSFSNLCSWRFLYHTKFAIVDNFLIFKFWAGDELAYMMPVGEGNLEKVLNELVEDARQEGEPFVCWVSVRVCAKTLRLSCPVSLDSRLTVIMPTTFICAAISQH